MSARESSWVVWWYPGAKPDSRCCSEDGMTCVGSGVLKGDGKGDVRGDAYGSDNIEGCSAYVPA